jgi:hypothetical protein
LQAARDPSILAFPSTPSKRRSARQPGLSIMGRRGATHSPARKRKKPREPPGPGKPAENRIDERSWQARCGGRTHAGGDCNAPHARVLRARISRILVAFRRQSPAAALAHIVCRRQPRGIIVQPKRLFCLGT